MQYGGRGQDDNLMRQGRRDLNGDSLLDNFNLSTSAAHVTDDGGDDNDCTADDTTETLDQITAVSEAAQAVPGCKIAGTNTDCTSMSDVRTDTLKDVSDRFLDISVLFVTESGPNTKFAHELFGIFTDESFNKFDSLEYFVVADLDNNASTGGAPADLGIPTTFEGAELVTRVQVFPFIIESPAHVVTVPTVWKFQASAFAEVPDPSIKARVDESIAPIHNGDDTVDVHTSDAVVIEFSNEVRGPANVPFRVQALSRGIQPGGTLVVDLLDNRPGEPGLELRLRSPTFPVCSVEPPTAPPGDTVIVEVTGLVPNSGVHAVFGDNTVAMGSTDAAGNASIPFPVPGIATEGPHLVTVDTDGTALTADCVMTVPPPSSAICFGVPATVVGTPSNDALNGTPGDDVIVGLGGNDAINGRGGNDLICGGDGNDAINAGAGNNEVDSGTGIDIINAGVGNDILNGGIDNDTLNSGAGNDTPDGGPGFDILNGGPGSDTCINGELNPGCP